MTTERPVVATRALGALVALLLVLTATGSVRADGWVAPELTLQDGINGVTARTRLANYRGKPLLIVFWIPICPHCPAMVARVHRLQQTYASRGLQVLAITHGKKRYVTQWLANQGYSMGVGFDWTGQTSSRFGVTMLPGLFLLDKDGHLKASGSAGMEAAIERELRRSTSP